VGGPKIDKNGPLKLFHFFEGRQKGAFLIGVLLGKNVKKMNFMGRGAFFHFFFEKNRVLGGFLAKINEKSRKNPIQGGF
jgi:hypothetical protein